MTENLSTIWQEYRPTNVTKGSIVIDIGSSEGYFTDWAKKQGAKVESYDARYDSPVGPYNGYCEVRGKGLGSYIVPGKGDVKMIGLGTILKKHKVVDFLKCDIEGGEYLIFNCDLSNINRFAIEFHVWTTPNKPIDGLGVQDEPMPSEAVDILIKQLSKTHHIEIVGDILAGGYIYGVIKKELAR